MRFSWLPDPDRYAHPLLAWLIECAFDVVLGWIFRVESDLPPGFRPPKGCMMVSNHLRDSDGPLIGRAVFRREGLHLRNPLPFFVMREDLYEREGLANLLHACPWPFIRVLGWIPLKWLFCNVRTFPLRRLREFTWHDTLRELARAGLGGEEPARVFNARGRRELRECLGELPPRVDMINPWRLKHMRVALWGLRRLNPDMLRHLAPMLRDTIERQLRFFADQLDAGHTVYFAPEGHVSMDGRFGRIRGGTWRLGRMTARPLPVFPFTLSYDPLAPGRTRVILRHGMRLDDLDYVNPRSVAERLRIVMTAQRVATPSHLLAHFLCMRECPFGMHELAAWMRGAVAAAREAQVTVDALFDRVSIDRLVDERVRWLARRRLVWSAHGLWHRRFSPDTAPSWLSTAGVVRYLANALADFAPDYAKALSR